MARGRSWPAAAWQRRGRWGRCGVADAGSELAWCWCARGARAAPAMGRRRRPPWAPAGLFAHGAGFGQIRPSKIFNGGDPTGLVSHITWTSWGGARASGPARATTSGPASRSPPDPSSGSPWWPSTGNLPWPVHVPGGGVVLPLPWPAVQPAPVPEHMHRHLRPGRGVPAERGRRAGSSTLRLCRKTRSGTSRLSAGDRPAWRRRMPPPRPAPGRS